MDIFNKNKKLFIQLILFIIIYSFPVFSQETNRTDENEQPAEEIISEETPVDENTGKEAVTVKKKGNIDIFMNNNLIFLLSVEDAVGFGGTLNFQYVTSVNLAFGLESGYYGARTEVEGFEDIGGFTLVPIYAVVEFDIPIVEDFYLSPVVKFGVAYTRARLNGWLGESAFSMIFEGGIRAKAFLGDGLLIQGNVCYGGLIEQSGLIHMLNIGLGFGF